VEIFVIALKDLYILRRGTRGLFFSFLYAITMRAICAEFLPFRYMFAE
jgi:hypothetical protein